MQGASPLHAAVVGLNTNIDNELILEELEAIRDAEGDDEASSARRAGMVCFCPSS